MWPLFSLLLLLTGLTGTRSLVNISKVSVKAGGSISIPCLYEPEYKYNMKYLCERHGWLQCNSLTTTRQEQKSTKKYMIIDDPRRKVFTVTINDLEAKDTNYYWCAVKKKDSDIKQYFKLSVSTGEPTLHVDNQEVRGFIGEDLTISCHYSNTGETQWCRLGGPCVRWSYTKINGTRVFLRSSPDGFFTVTMKKLKTESSGWYFCASGDLQMPVHVTVEQRPPTTPRALTTVPPTTESVHHTSVYATSELSTMVQNGGRSHSLITTTVIIIIIIIATLIFISTVTIFILFLLKKRKKSRTSPATTAAGDVTYSEVTYKRKNHSVLTGSPAEENEETD